jgi:predicted O-methyltransferase YrrM
MQRRHWHTLIGLLKKRPHKVGAEVGVFRGVFAQRLLANLPKIEKYYCIDPWEHYEDHVKTLRSRSAELSIAPSQAFNQFRKATKPWEKKIVVIRKMSQDALADVPDMSLDWVFIDGNHSYEYVKEDIPGWTSKVKLGGIVSGHDFYDKSANARRDVPFGVERAVVELVRDFTVDAEANVWYTIKE